MAAEQVESERKRQQEANLRLSSALERLESQEETVRKQAQLIESLRQQVVALLAALVDVLAPAPMSACICTCTCAHVCLTDIACSQGEEKSQTADRMMFEALAENAKLRAQIDSYQAELDQTRSQLQREFAEVLH
jgi:hypothetical protein